MGVLFIWGVPTGPFLCACVATQGGVLCPVRAGTKSLHLELICVNTHVHGKPPCCSPIHMCISNRVCVHKHTQIMDTKLSICPSHPLVMIPPRNIKPACVNTGPWALEIPIHPEEQRSLYLGGQSLFMHHPHTSVTSPPL